MTDPTDLVGAARSMIGSSQRALGASALIAAALLLRQALEDAIRRRWQRDVPGLERCTGRTQLIALPFYVEDRELALASVYAWNRLSELCHHDDGGIAPPTRGELHALAATISRLAAALEPA